MVSCSLTRAVLGDELADKLNVREVQEVESTLDAPKNSHPYVENYHWHSGRSLEVDHRHHGEYDVRATQKYLKFVHTYAESLEGMCLLFRDFTVQAWCSLPHAPPRYHCSPHGREHWFCCRVSHDPY